MPNRGNAIKLFSLIAVIIVCGVFLFQPLMQRIGLGLDLQGGVHVVLQADPDEGETVTAEQMKQLQSVMRQRVDELGVSEPIIQLSGNNRLVIELAGIEDPEQAVEMIGKTAKLEFIDYEGNIVVTGDKLKEARAILNDKNEAEISIEFDSAGTKLFADATSKLVSTFPSNDERRVIGIVLDDEVLTTPYVRQPITNGSAVIQGGFATYEEAADLAALLRGGSLPVGTKIIEKRTVGPTLGSDSLASSSKAMVVGIILLAIFMIVFYRIPGLVADITLIVFALLLLTGLVVVGAVLTLPGLAGILLTVAMASDANIIIFERIKDELRSGKSLRASVDSGFKRAFWTIFDSNLTTMIAAAVLFKFGAGSIRGFALTLGIGIIANMITALFLTRIVLRLVVKIPFLQKHAYYGVSEKGADLSA